MLTVHSVGRLLHLELFRHNARFVGALSSFSVGFCPYSVGSLAGEPWQAAGMERVGFDLTLH